MKLTKTNEKVIHYRAMQIRPDVGMWAVWNGDDMLKTGIFTVRGAKKYIDKVMRSW